MSGVVFGLVSDSGGSVRPLARVCVGFHHPQPLVGSARDLGEDVGRVLILCASRDLDRLADGAAECCEHVRHGMYVLLAAAAGRVLVERAALGDLPGGTI